MRTAFSVLSSPNVPATGPRRHIDFAVSVMLTDPVGEEATRHSTWVGVSVHIIRVLGSGTDRKSSEQRKKKTYKGTDTPFEWHRRYGCRKSSNNFQKHLSSVERRLHPSILAVKKDVFARPREPYVGC